MKRTLLVALLTGQVLAQPGLHFEQIPPPPEKKQATPSARTRPLSLADLQLLLARLPALKAQPADQQSFVLQQSPPPDKPGLRLVESFPPPQQSPPPVAEKKPVEIISYAPQGEVEMAPEISLTFNQPLAQAPEARITPQIPGEWRWIGSQTLVFKPEKRLPMATEFQVQVQTEKPLQWSFGTSPPRLKTTYPANGKTSLQPVIFLEFNQAIDRRRTLPFITLDGFELRAASPEEIEADPKVKELAREAQPDNWLAVIPVEPLPRRSACTIRVLKGLTSTEGPRPTTSVSEFHFETLAPLTVDAGPPDNSPPDSAIPISFSNDLEDQDIVVTALPAASQLAVRIYYGNLWLYGNFRGGTAYQVNLPAGIRDVFGQATSEPISLRFTTGNATPRFEGPDKDFLILDPDGPPQLSFQVINHSRLKVQVRAVKPTDWEAFQERRDWPGQLILDEEIETHARADESQKVAIDLKDCLQKSKQLLVLVSPPDAEQYRTYAGWVQRSQLGASLIEQRQNGWVWINQLRDGKPLPSVQVTTLEGEAVAESDSEGLAKLPSSVVERGFLICQGGDQLFWPGRIASGFYRNDEDRTRWYVNDDRKLYKPGEQVCIKGWLRREIHQPRGGMELPKQTSLDYTFEDKNSKELLHGTVPIERLGSFQFKFQIPKQIDLGKAELRLKAGDDTTTHPISIEEFRRPEFEVSAKPASTSSFLGGTGSLSVEANYFSGGKLKNAPVTWKVEAQATSFSPPDWQEYTFGMWRPWWDFWGWKEEPEHPRFKTFVGSTGALGRHTLDLRFLSADEPRPYTLSAEATVLDASHKSWATSTQLLVHPATVYVGLKAKRTFVEAGQPLEYQLIVTDSAGKPVAGRPVKLTLARQEWAAHKYRYRDILSRQMVSSEQPQSLSLLPNEGGTYRVEALVSDADNRSNLTTVTSWVAGGQPAAPSRRLELEHLTLVPDKKLYQPGDTAEILVQAPFAQGYGMVTWERHGLVGKQLLELHDGSAIAKIPLEADFIPNLQVNFEVAGKAPRGKPQVPDRPAQAAGALNLEISPDSRRLKVDVHAAQPQTRPGSPDSLEVSLKDTLGRPVSQSDVALMVVDEAILALSGGKYPDPLDIFCQPRSAEVKHRQMRDKVELALADEIETPAPRISSASGAAGATNVTFADVYRTTLATPLSGGALSQAGPFEIIGNRDAGIGAFQGAQTITGANAFPLDIGTFARKTPGAIPIQADPNHIKPQPKIRVRSNFDALACYMPNAHTDAAGLIHLPFKLPDNLTRYRIVALAAAGKDCFGKGESSLTAQQPLMVRPSPPRFLNLGDRCELPVLVQNQTNHALPVQIACRTTNLSLDPSKAGLQFSVPANDRVEVRFPVSTQKAGTARLQMAVSSPDFADAASAEIPVLTPATSEDYASYGTLDEGTVAQPLTPPADAYPEFGGLEVSTSSTALSELTDAFLYLRHYEFECAEQVSSRVLSTVALEPVLRAFGSKELPGPEMLRGSLQSDIRKLEDQQNSDGGWDYWEKGRPSVPYVSLHVTHALVRLHQAQYQVPKETLEQALRYAESIEDHIPDDYPKECRPALRAYALYVLKKAGRPNPSRARELLRDWGGVEKTPLETLGWLLPTLSHQPEGEVIRRHLNNRVNQTASSAQFTSSYGEGEHLILASDQRADAVLLEALIQESPQSELLPKLVRGLLDKRIAGRWRNTQENCFVLLALHDYFERFEKVTPDFVARLWLGDRFAGDQAFRGHSADSKELRVPMGELAGPTRLLFSKEGPGRLYYRVGLKYAPRSLQLPALERGFIVQRTYESTEDNRDVSHQADGSWHIKVGARVKVTVSMVAPAARNQVALVDRLPAGLEILNPVLEGSGAPKREWWDPRWFDHENLRDDRAEAFCTRLHGGYYSYSYYARATSTGRFVAPPAKAEEMYHPETFGRSATDQVVVE